MWNDAKGFMAIWSDVEPKDYQFYHDWLLKEHFPERVGVPGFLNARVFRRPIGESSQFFIIYETESTAVLASAAYVERLNNPTPMSREVMPKLRNFVRGAGQVVSSNGLTSGGYALTYRFTDAQQALSEPEQREALLDRLRALPRILAVRLFEVEQTATGIQTEEKKIRTSVEEGYSQLLVVEAPDDAALEAASEVLGETLALAKIGHHAGRYNLIGELQKRSLP